MKNCSFFLKDEKSYYYWCRFSVWESRISSVFMPRLQDSGAFNQNKKDLNFNCLSYVPTQMESFACIEEFSGLRDYMQLCYWAYWDCQKGWKWNEMYFYLDTCCVHVNSVFIGHSSRSWWKCDYEADQKRVVFYIELVVIVLYTIFE